MSPHFIFSIESVLIHGLQDVLQHSCPCSSFPGSLQPRQCPRWSWAQWSLSHCSCGRYQGRCTTTNLFSKKILIHSSQVAVGKRTCSLPNYIVAKQQNFASNSHMHGCKSQVFSIYISCANIDDANSLVLSMYASGTKFHSNWPTFFRMDFILTQLGLKADTSYIVRNAGGRV